MPRDQHPRIGVWQRLALIDEIDPTQWVRHALIDNDGAKHNVIITYNNISYVLLGATPLIASSPNSVIVDFDEYTTVLKYLWAVHIHHR